MAVSVQMPALGESVTEGTVTRWLKQEGDTVEVDEPLLEVSTDKVDTEIPSPASGVLTKIVAQEDDTVEVGGELAVIGEAGDDGGGRRRAEAAEEPAEEPEPAAEEEPSPSQSPSPNRSPQPEPAAQLVGGGDATPVLMPELGESVTEGTVTRWLKKVGDSRRGRRAAGRGLHRQGRHRDPLTGGRDADQHHRRGGRHRRRRRRAGQDRRRRRRAGPRAQAGTQAGAETGAQARTEGRTSTRAQARAQARTQARAQAGTRSQRPPAAAARRRRDGSPYVTPLVRKLAVENGIDLATRQRHRRRRANPQAGCAGRRGSQEGTGRAGRRGRRPHPPPAARGARHRRRWRICAAPRRRPTGSGRSPPRRPANRCRPPRS